MTYVPRQIEEALAATGKPWELKTGAKHTKIVVDGQLAGILPRSKSEHNRRALLNTVAQIRRAASTGRAARRG